MSRFSRVMSLLAVPVLFAACSPGSTDTPLSPSAPRHDGGLLVGGNAVPTDSTQPAPSSTTSASGGDGIGPAPGAVPPDTTGRGLLVGGN